MREHITYLDQQSLERFRSDFHKMRIHNNPVVMQTNPIAAYESAIRVDSFMQELLHNMGEEHDPTMGYGIDTVTGSVYRYDLF
jgi:hypothetical protein